MERIDFNKGVHFDYYTTDATDVVQIKNWDKFYKLPANQLEQVLLLVALGNKFQTSNKMMLIQRYLNTVLPIHVPSNEGYFSRKTHRSKRKILLESLYDDFITEITNEDTE